MNEILNKVSELVEESKNIPERIKPIVKAICRAYIRESNGKIPIEGIINVCNTAFTEKEETDYEFRGKDNIFAETDTNYDKEGNVIHKVNYVNTPNYIKLISILTHELGHVITESKPCEVTADGKYPIAKRTATIYYNLEYRDSTLFARNIFGYRISDGFLESISSKIFASREFRQELLDSGYDLKDYVYKDERIFPSRSYDEYKACFELFDYIMDGVLTDFSCRTFNSNEEIEEFINKYKLKKIFYYLDKSNDSNSDLKEYEGKEYNKEFNQKLRVFLEDKDTAINLAYVCLEIFNKSEDDEIFKILLDRYKKTLEKQKLLPIPEEYFHVQLK